jgi:hypothetical protein
LYGEPLSDWRFHLAQINDEHYVAVATKPVVAAVTNDPPRQFMHVRIADLLDAGLTFVLLLPYWV